MLLKVWPLADAVKIEYAKGKVVSKVYSPGLAKKKVYNFKRSANYSLSDARSLRSREAAILGSRMSDRASDLLVQESLFESIRESLRESQQNINQHPVFRMMYFQK